MLYRPALWFWALWIKLDLTSGVYQQVYNRLWSSFDNILSQWVIWGCGNFSFPLSSCSILYFNPSDLCMCICTLYYMFAWLLGQHLVRYPIIVSWSKMKASNTNFTFLTLGKRIMRSTLFFWLKYSLLCSLNRTRFSSTSGVVWWQFHLALDVQETHVALAGLWGCDIAHMGLAYTEQHGKPRGSQTSQKTGTGWVKAIWKTSSHHHQVHGGVRAEELKSEAPLVAPTGCFITSYNGMLGYERMQWTMIFTCLEPYQPWG